MGRVLVPVNLPALPLIVVWAGMVWMSGCIHRRMAGAEHCPTCESSGAEVGGDNLCPCRACDGFGRRPVPEE